MTTARFQKREGDGRFMTGMNWIMRFVVNHATAKVAIWAGSLSALAGAALTLLVMRTLALSQIAAQDIEHSGRMTKIEVSALLQDTITTRAVDSLRNRMNRVEGHTGMLVRSECLRNSKADQELIGMECPPNLYRGVPR